MRFIGNLSYSLYIWQQLFLGGQGQQLPVTLGVAAAFACAYLSYRFIEQPSIALGRGVVPRQEATCRGSAGEPAIETFKG
jgi:peptidoglycan/LPS O-acetylase OafA/YrhL